MAEIFKNKHTGRCLIALSLVPIIVQIFLRDDSIIDICLNWLAAGVLAWFIWDMFEEHKLGILGRNHSLAISWAVISLMLNFALVNFNEFETALTSQRWLFFNSYEVKYLMQLGGFTAILSLVLHSWQLPIAPVHYIVCGLIIGFLSTFLDNTLLWLLLFPVFFYQMRTNTTRNYGSLVTGVFLAIWICYVVRLLIFGEEDADGFIVSYGSFFNNLLPDVLSYSLREWFFLIYIALLLIIYSISGFAINVAKTVKAHASVVMLSVLSLLVTAFTLIDLSHLPNYIGTLSILLSMHISIHQSCIISIKNDWWTVILIVILVILNVFPVIWQAFC